MISIYNFLWKRLEDYAKKFQSGMDTVDEFNGKIAEVQLEVFNDLSTYYQSNEMVRALLDVWVRKIEATSPSTGLITRPMVTGEKFMRIIAMGVTNGSGELLYEMSQYTETELAIANRVPQRKPSLANKIVAYIPYNKQIQLYPKQAIPYHLFYFIYPKEAKISFTYSETDDELVMAFDPANTVDLEWDENASNIILYKLLEKYGIVNREMLLAEYGKLGVNLSLGGQQA